MKNKIARHRILLSKFLLLVFISVLMISEHGYVSNKTLSISFDMIGFALVLIGGFGRIWASLYIEGSKTGKLVSKGPYSMMRNPLYVFSVIILIGYCLAIQSIVVASVSLILFILIYVPTVYSEEKNLLGLHDEVYNEYYQKTPRFFPKISLYQETSLGQDSININIRKIRNVLIEISGFIFFFGIIKLFDLLHHINILPKLFVLL